MENPTPYAPPVINATLSLCLYDNTDISFSLSYQHDDYLIETTPPRFDEWIIASMIF